MTDAPPPEPRPQNPPNLRAQVALLLAFATLPVGVLAVAQGFNTYNDIAKLQRAALAGEATRISDRERGAIREAFGALSALRTQLDPERPAEEDCAARMETYVRAQTGVTLAGVVSEDGVMRCVFPPSPPLDLTTTPEYPAFLADPRRTVTVYPKGRVTGEPVIVASEPIFREGALTGSIAVSLPSAYLAWASAPGRPEGAHFAILDRRGVEAAGYGAADWLPDGEGVARLLEAGERIVVLPDAGGEDRIYAVTPLFGRDIFAVSSWPDDRAPGDISWPQLLTLLLPLVMWALAVGVAYYAVDRFALRHVVYLDRLVSAYARSRRSLRAKGVRDAPLEFAKLGSSFDRMAQEIEEREHALRAGIAEKDALLKEVYHRVKNNLQMIVSLTNLQLREARSEGERESLTRLQNRIHGLAAVHQRLSEAERMNAVRVDALLEDIARTMRDGRGAGSDGIALTFDTVPHTEGPDRALPLALFATEAVSNAFAHALEGQGEDWLHVALRPDDDGERMVLEIVNGRAAGTPAPETAPAGLGSRLIDGFAGQLRGRVERESHADSYALRLVFPRSA